MNGDEGGSARESHWSRLDSRLDEAVDVMRKVRTKAMEVRERLVGPRLPENEKPKDSPPEEPGFVRNADRRIVTLLMGLDQIGKDLADIS